MTITVHIAMKKVLTAILLCRFHDHQMLTSRKDNLGTELLSLPFRKEDLEAILEDLTT